jgi:broad specificity phosphatase PhoE
VPAQLLLVRHGQSIWNADGRWQGQADPALSALGTRQAKAAALTLGTFDAIVASDLDRARSTAEIIASELGVGPVMLDADLRERSAGDWEGLTKDQIEAQYPGWLAERRTPPGWEDDEVLIERAVGALARIAAAIGDDGTALVLSHGGVIRALYQVTTGERLKVIPNVSGVWFEVGRGVFRAGDTVVLIDHEVTVPDQI